jgi:predicted nuclease with TOPRIM domain
MHGEELKRVQAECKIWSDAIDALEKKLEAFHMKYDELKHEHTALAAQNEYVMGLVRSAEAAFYDIVTNDVFTAHQHTPVDWAGCCGKLVAALRPIFTHRG